MASWETLYVISRSVGGVANARCEDLAGEIATQLRAGKHVETTALKPEQSARQPQPGRFR
jgi:hypothetical protein